jgi:exoribonuclease II
MKKQSLVLYKNGPALIINIGEKIEIQLKDKSVKKVRSKDIILLHEGPCNNLSVLDNLPAPSNSDLNDTRELLLENPVELSEFAELLLGENSPLTAWATCLLLQEGLYFKGTIENIQSRTDDEVNLTLSKKSEKEKAEKEKLESLNRIKNGKLLKSDYKYMRDVESLALKLTTTSRLMQELKITQTPENAHSLLLKTQTWTKYKNPYPERCDISEIQENITIPDIPEEERRNLTYLDSFAIDDKGSKDPDDAISIDGEFLWVHIADVASIVTPDSDLDKLAAKRGANLYLPEKTVTMLPVEVTEKLALGLSETSPALSFKISLDKDSNANIEEITLSIIKVTRLSYDSANEVIANEPLKSIFEFTEIFREKRVQNGAIEIELPEAKVKYNKENNQIKISLIKELDSRKLVVNSMLMTGEAVARFAVANEIPIPFATQELKEDIQTPETMAGMFSCRMKFRPAVMQKTPGKHSGLGLDFYTRTTSPLRRYSDLLVHQQIRTFLKDEFLMSEEEVLDKATTAASKIKDITFTERNSNKHWMLVYLEETNWTGDAVLVDIYNGKGVYIIPELAFEFRMPINSGIKLNSTIKIKFNSYDLPNLNAHFTQVED